MTTPVEKASYYQKRIRDVENNILLLQSRKLQEEANVRRIIEELNKNGMKCQEDLQLRIDALTKELNALCGEIEEVLNA